MRGGLPHVGFDRDEVRVGLAVGVGADASDAGAEVLEAGVVPDAHIQVFSVDLVEDLHRVVIAVHQAVAGGSDLHSEVHVTHAPAVGDRDHVARAQVELDVRIEGLGVRISHAGDPHLGAAEGHVHHEVLDLVGVADAEVRLGRVLDAQLGVVAGTQGDCENDGSDRDELLRHCHYVSPFRSVLGFALLSTNVVNRRAKPSLSITGFLKSFHFMQLKIVRKTRS